MIRPLLLAAGLATAVAGCTTDPNTGQSSVSNTGIGAGAGAAVGAGAGALIGGWQGALIGAGIGAAAGAGIGYLLDEQEREFNERLAQSQVQVSRDQSQGQEAILLTMPSGVTFQTDSATIQPGFRPTLDEVAATLNEYPDSRIAITGHTDSTGSADYNQTLSQQRADAVANYLISRGVAPSRITAYGAGETQPVATNETDSGRAANRRVEIRVVPNA